MVNSLIFHICLSVKKRGENQQKPPSTEKQERQCSVTVEKNRLKSPNFKSCHPLCLLFRMHLVNTVHSYCSKQIISLLASMESRLAETLRRICNIINFYLVISTSIWLNSTVRIRRVQLKFNWYELFWLFDFCFSFAFLLVPRITLALFLVLKETQLRTVWN